jgi:serine/threonine protein kinase
MATLGNYEILRTLGQGAFAQVKLARNTTNGDLAALKIIKGDVNNLS